MTERSINVGNMTTSKQQSLSQHQQAIHEGKKHPCRESDNQATEKGSLAKHQQEVIEERSTHAGNVTTRLSKKVI